MATKNKNEIKARTPQTIPVDMIIIDKEKNYTSSTRGNIEELAKTIATEGMQTPVKVYKNANGQFVLQAGFRRMAAVNMINDRQIDCKKDGKFIKIEAVPVVFEQRYANEADRDVHQLLENSHREDTTALEKAKAYRKLIDVHGLELEEVAARLGENKENIKRYMSLLQATQPVRKALEKGQVGATAAAKIAKTHPEDKEAQKEALKLAIEAGGGKKATLKATKGVVGTGKPRQSTRTVAEVKDIIEKVEGLYGSSAQFEKVIICLHWFLGAKETPWDNEMFD